MGRRKLFVIFLLLMMLGLFIFGTSHLTKGSYNYVIVNYILVLILTIFIILLRYLKNGKPIYRISTMLLAVILFYWIRTGAVQGYASIWAVIFPLYSFFLLGKKEGFIWTILCAIMITSLYINPYSYLTDFTYPVQFVSRHLFLYFMVFLFTYNYESVQEKYKAAMEAEIKFREQTESELRRHQDHLEEIVAERTLEITKNSLEKEKLQEQLAQSQKMEALGTLVGGLAHDFNNFLAGIIGSFDLLSRVLEKEKLDKKDNIEKYLHLGMESSKRSAGLINQLLILSKRHEINLAPLDINNTLNHIYELCRNSFPKSIELNFRIEEAPLIIMGDMGQIEQVLLNLCINASHAMTIMRPPGAKHGGILTVTAEKVKSDYIMKENYLEAEGIVDYWIRIKVSDTGVGIDYDTKQRIFEPFFSTKNKNESSGLGLAISYNIIKKHGGIINVYSEPGSGSCFSIYFPVYNDSNKITRDDNDQEIVSGSGTVLIIDDELLILNIAKGFLEQCGYSVITAQGADAGIEIYNKEHSRISAVLLDLSMPGKSGLEVFQELHKIDANVKVILSSGMLDNETKDIALKMGIIDILNKPYIATELSIKIKKVISMN